ncbi:MAG: HYR domain-containing protein [Lewinellaceae bacterium]|nr:HYR domain-containing protein [Saprospiraceae bacterium]MCB9311722.1 HYR domain-containing protein [Lewinellaceae bacterium]
MQALVHHRWLAIVLSLGLWFSLVTFLTATPVDFPAGMITSPNVHPSHPRMGGLEVICPNDQTVYAANGLNGAYVQWTPPQVSTDCPLCIVSIPGCQSLGEFNGHSYFLSNNSTSWSMAAQYASSQGGYLASISSEEENQFIAKQLIGTTAFIGLHDLLVEGQYQWHSGEPFLFSRWIPGEPNNGNGQTEQDAVEMLPSGGWQDTEDQKPKRFVVEIPCVDIQQTAGPANGSFFPVGTTLIAYTISDPCGHVALCSFSVTVLPAITADCPDDIHATCQPGINGAVVSWDLPVASSICSSCGQVPPNTIDMGSFNGSHYYCTNSLFQWTNGQAFAASYGGHLASIGSSAENQYLSGVLQLPEAFIGLNDLSVEGQFVWASLQPFNFSNWEIGQPQNINGNEDVVVMLSGGAWKTVEKQAYKECIIEIPCLTITQIKGPPPGSVFPPGSTEIKYKITDPCGNFAYCSFHVIVSGGISLECPDDVTLDCQPGKNGASYSWTIPSLWSCCTDCPQGDPIPGFVYMGEFQGSHYYCSLDKQDWGMSQSICLANGGHLVVLNSSDENDWLAAKLLQTTAWIGLTDEQVEGQFRWVNGEPLAFTHWMPGQPDNGGITNEDYAVLHPDGFWSDELGHVKKEYIMELPCESVVQISGPPPGSVFPVGTTIVTYKATDGCGQMATCSFQVTVKDCCYQVPEIQCPDDYYGCPDTPMDPSVTGWAMSWTPDGPCGKVEITWTDQMISQGNCWDKVIKRTWRAAYDANPQLYATCVQYIYLEDKEPPTYWDCPDDITVAPGPDCKVKVGWAAPIPMDNCSAVTTIVSHQPGSTFYEGTTTVVYTFIDACGNKTQCSFTVTVTTCCQAPEITCPPDIQGCPGESISPLVTGFATSITPDGPCGNIEIDFEDEVVHMGGCGDQTIERTWTAYYDADPTLSASCLQVIVLEDKTAPIIADLPDDITICPTPLIPFGTPTAEDNCGQVTLTYTDIKGPGDCQTGQMVTRTWTAEDECGNSATASQTAVLLDNTPPVVWECPEDVTVQPNADCEAIVQWDPPGVMDNCGQVSTLSSHAPGSTFQEGVTTVIYTFTDECGNLASCSFTITVEPCCILPELKCPGKYQACPGEPTDPSVAGEPELVGPGNCGLLDLSYSDWIMDSSGCPGSAKIGRTWTLTAVGDTTKKVECVQWVQTIDEEPPVFDSCPQDIVVYTEEFCPVVVFWNEPQVTDNCSDFTLTYTHYPGDTYYPGETEVQYWADDVCGNASFCIFTIHVIPLSNPPYCESRGENSDALWVEEMVLQGENLSSGNDCGWGAHDAIDHLLPWGEDVELTVVPGYEGEALPAYIRTWVDWNRDGDFFDFGELVYDAKELSYGPRTIQFTVPPFAVAGPSFIRTVVKYTDIETDSTLPEACGLFAQGEVEDLLIQLVTITSVDDLSDGHIQLYPNPSTGSVFLSGSTTSVEPVRGYLVNMLGQMVREWHWSSGLQGEVELDLHALPAGSYRLLLQSKNGQQILEVIRQ